MPPKKPKQQFVCERIATVLQDWTAGGGSQKAIAERSGLSPSQVSLFFRGLVHPERDTFERLADQFDSKTRARLVEAYILDGLTPRYQSQVTVRVREADDGGGNIVREEGPGYVDEVEEHLVWLRRMVKTSREWREWFLNQMRLFRGGKQG